MKDRRVAIPVLLVLLAFLGGSGYLVYRNHEAALEGERPGARRTGSPRPAAESEAGQGTWRHHAWGASERPERATEPSGSSPSGLIPRGDREREDERYDPQLWAMRRSFPIEADAGTPLPFPPTERRAVLVSGEGALPVSRGARCDVRVLPVQAGRFNCLVRVICDGRVLYPNPTETAGYAPCEIEGGAPISALDQGHTALDGDPRVRVDLRAGTVTVSDEGDGVEAFSATLRIDPPR